MVDDDDIIHADFGYGDIETVNVCMAKQYYSQE